MIDLADRAPQGGEPGLLPKCGAQACLHLDQFPLGDADLVAAPAGLDGGREILRIVAEGDHRLGQAPHGPDHQPLQAEIDEGGGDQGDDDGKGQDALGIIDEGGAHRGLVDHHLDHRLGILGRGAHHPDDAIVALPESLEGIADQAEEMPMAEIVGGIDLGHAGLRPHHQLHPVRPLQRHHIGPGMLHQLGLQGIADHVIGRGEQGQDGDMGGRQPVSQIFEAEAPGRGCIDQNLAQHDEGDGQQQDPRREALAQRRESKAMAIGRHRGPPPQPSRASSRTRRRLRSLNSLGRKKLPAARLPISLRVG